jgi:large subunit ribosomal protein L13
MVIIIDATDLIVGRLATYAAKQALLGNEVRVINSEKAVFSGRKENTFAAFQEKRTMGTPRKGPFIHRMPERILRRSIKGMLPHKKPRGRVALKKILCYIGVPDEFKDKKPVTIEGASMSKLPNLKFVSLLNLSRRLGAKIE